MLSKKDMAAAYGFNDVTALYIFPDGLIDTDDMATLWDSFGGLKAVQRWDETHNGVDWENSLEWDLFGNVYSVHWDTPTGDWDKIN